MRHEPHIAVFVIQARIWRHAVFPVLSAFLLLWAPSLARSDSTDDLARAAERWAQENLDDDTLKALQSADGREIENLLARLAKQFQSDYVLDLGQLKDPVQSLLPMLESYEETLPYAAWLRAHLDELQVAQDFAKRSNAKKPSPGQPTARPPNPRPSEQREIWITQFADRPVPKSAKPYLADLKRIFREQHAPEQLVWIAEVESGFQPRARSPRGAVGMFQLMPDTARRFDLRVSVLDQRLDPQKSAAAAAKYLAYLQKHYRDWRLALAAYNAGEGTVDRLLKKQKRRTFDTICARLPSETQMFVPKVEAAIRKREGQKLADLPASL